MLDENANWIRRESLEAHVAALNNPENTDVLATEWEVAVLNALSKVGTVVHEHEFSSGVKPDVGFRSKTLHFIADIRAVSDRGLDGQNPVEALNNDLYRRVKPLRDRGINGGFFLRIGQRSVPGVGGDEPVRLKLPPQNSWKALIFGAAFREFTEAIARAPRHPRVCHVQNAETDVEITYKPTDRFWGMTHALYTLAKSKKRNPVFGALAAKASQLKRVPDVGTKGIILCDGDCDLLRSRRTSDWASFGLDDIVNDFLRQHTSIHFVLVFVVQHDGSTRSIGPENLSLHPRLYFGRAVGDDLKARVNQTVERAMKFFPRPINTAQNARYRLEWARRSGQWDKGSSHYGGMTVTSNTIKISARAILELLAGTLEQRTFLEDHNSEGGTPFAHKLHQGRLIRDVKIVPSDIPEDDDEWLEFQFGAPDPAVFRYQVSQVRGD